MAKEGLGHEITELRLGLPGSKKRVFSEVHVDADDNTSSNTSDAPSAASITQNKVQIVGWPPVSSHRKKCDKLGTKLYVKVGMDGTPFLRKVDLKAHTAYPDLVFAFQKLFGCVRNGGMLKDAEGSDYIPIYEDKDGDWMLVGDVPWEMFIDSCKRLRIMKRSDAKGVQLSSRISGKKYHG